MNGDARRLAWGLLLGLFAALGGALRCGAEGPAAVVEAPSSVADLSQRAEKLFAQLDDNRYEVRAKAAEEFEALMRRPECGAPLAAAVQKALVDPKLSFEVRFRLTRWAKRLPPADPPPAVELSADELDALVGGLDSDDYGARLAAAARLRWHLRNPKAVAPALGRLKARYADPATATATRERLEEAWQTARAGLFLGDPSSLAISSAADAQIDRWLDEVAASWTDEQSRVAGRVAEMELLDCMAVDAESPRVTKAAESRLASVPDPAGRARLEKLIELGKPALVAEYWAGRVHRSEQHLLVGVPSRSVNAVRPSHFDRIDDQTAHCVSGNTLAPGDYPANVAFFHPSGSGFFRLVNLSTPRRRMAYEYEAQRDDRVRLSEISRQTLDRFLAANQPLTDQELKLLAELDQREVSRFASAWLMRMDDKPLGGDERRYLATGCPSRHGVLCEQLAVEGTQEAAPGLTEAIAKDRFLPPTSAAPYRLHYVAALSIARRDPWKGVEAWLDSQLDSTQPMADNGRPDGPTVGATVAGVLLACYDQPAGRFGLQPAVDGVLLQFGLNGYRFAAPEDAATVRKFLETQREKHVHP